MQSEREENLLNDFINRGVLKGWFIGEFPIGRKRLGKMGIDYRVGKFYIDMVCVEGIYGRKPMRFDFRYEEFIMKEIEYKWVWLLEAKRELNAESIGQILIDKYLFPEDYPQIRIKGLGIICRKADEVLKEICGKMGIEVFVAPHQE
ncbi:MAG: hypothetical protein LM601_08780 [Candidatus Verstraetearchaeota archaeon]|nr:hypothetical protein [Candidatus Verstraetearchaeota archaeon]